MRQALSEVVALDQISNEYKTVVQVAGLRAGIVDICRQDATSPDDFRRMLTRTLQSTLPRTTLGSIRADASHMPNAEFAKTEAKVRDAVFAAAHDSATLRPVVSKDRTGREQTEFFGKKSAWMNQYKSPAMLARSIAGQPVRLPTILS